MCISFKNDKVKSEYWKPLHADLYYQEQLEPQTQESLAPSNVSLKAAFGPAFICITSLPLAYRYGQICIHKVLFMPKCHFSHHKFRLHLQLLLWKGFVQKKCACIWLVNYRVMVLSPFSWVLESTHGQQKANSLFPSARRIWMPLSEACSSRHIVRQDCPASTETQFKLQGAQRRNEGSSLSPSLPPQSFALWQEMPARCKQDTGQNGWGYSGDSCSQSPLPPLHFRYATGHPVFKATEPVSCLLHQTCFQTSLTGRVEESPPAFKAGIGTEGPQLPSDRWQKWYSSLETEALTGRWDPHILVPALVNAFSIGSKRKVSAGETTTPNPRTPPG